MEQFLESLKLMVIGMGTVFCVLLLVILLGNLLIKFINKFVPEEQASAPAEQGGAINPKVAQAITAAINIATGGKGVVEKIEKIK